MFCMTTYSITSSANSVCKIGVLFEGYAELYAQIDANTSRNVAIDLIFMIYLFLVTSWKYKKSSDTKLGKKLK